MIEEVFAEVVEIRPERKLFIRERIIGPPRTAESDQSPVDLQLFFQHGSCATELQYFALVDSLSKLLENSSTSRGLRVRCISYDVLGCGQSPVVRSWEAYSSDELESDLGAVVKARVDKTSPIVFVAHSYGPTMLTRWINKTKGQEDSPLVWENVKGFVFIASAIHVDKNLPFPKGGHPIFMLPLWALNLLQPTLSKEFLQKGVHESRTELRETLSKANDDNDMFMVKAFYRQTSWATADQLKTCIEGRPALVIHGVGDGIISVDLGQKLVDALDSPNVTFSTFENTSHLVMVEDPDAVAKSFQEFIESSILPSAPET